MAVSEREPSPGTVPAPGTLLAVLQELSRLPAGDEEAAPVAPGPGQRVGRFEVVRELGRGGFGVVLEARDPVLGRHVALKLVRPGRSVDQLGAPGLEEADAVARLSHPNIVQIHDAGMSEAGPYLVFELLRGEPLAARLERGPMPVAEAARVALEAARGLAHAHASAVVHRDLKPSNVFLCEGGQVKVLDFGMALVLGRRRPVEGGTPGWMAPEQRRGAPEDERTDVWALGAILFRCLAGQDPASSQLSIPDTPELEALVERMLAPDPVKRPRDAREVVQALEPIVRDLGRVPPAAVRIRRRRSRPRLVLSLAVVGLLAAVLGLGLYLRSGRLRDMPESERSVAVLPFTNLSPEAENAFFADGVHSEIITQLARISGLRVIARGSVQQYREGARDLPAIAAALGVSTLLEGTVQRAGSRVRIATQLVQAATRQPLWAQSYDGNLADTFAMQTDVALDIARTLGARLSGSEQREVERSPTADREAHDLYLRALTFWERSMGVESDNRTAEELLRKALARDPSFALAHAKLAQVAAEWKRDCVTARASADRAMALQPDSAEAHAALGHFQYYCAKNTVAGVEAYEAAARSAPGDAQILTYLGFLRIDAGRVDAGLADLERARDLDPRSYAVGIYYALALASVRRFEEAEAACRRALELQPGDAFATVLGGLIPFWRDGDPGPAGRALDALPREWPAMGDGARYVVELLALLPERALTLAQAGRLPDPVSDPPFVPRAFVVARAHSALGQPGPARAGFASARTALEARVKAEPDEPGPRLTLARCYAGLGRAADALREVGAAEDLLRTQGLAGAGLRPWIAEIALAAGRRDLALAALRAALEGRDGFVTPASLLADPRFVALRGDPALGGLASEGTGAKP